MSEIPHQGLQYVLHLVKSRIHELETQINSDRIICRLLESGDILPNFDQADKFDMLKQSTLQHARNLNTSCELLAAWNWLNDHIEDAIANE